jgi:hypothetical protein
MMILEPRPHCRPRHERALHFTHRLLRIERIPLLSVAFADFAFDVYREIRDAIDDNPTASALRHMRTARAIWRDFVDKETAAVAEACRPIAIGLVKKKFRELEADDVVQEGMHQMLCDPTCWTWLPDQMPARRRMALKNAAWALTCRQHRASGRHPTKWNVDMQAMSLESFDPAMPEIGLETADDREFDLQQDDEAMLEVMLDDLLDHVVNDCYPNDSTAERFDRTILLRAKFEKLADVITARLLRGRILPNSIAARRHRIYSEIKAYIDEQWKAGSEEPWVKTLQRRFLRDKLQIKRDATLLDVVLGDLIDIVDEVCSDVMDSDRLKRRDVLKADFTKLAKTITRQLIRRSTVISNAARQNLLVKKLKAFVAEELKAGSKKPWVILMHLRLSS